MIEQLTAEDAGEFDYFVVLDASTSMGKPSLKFAGKTRWEEGQESLAGICRDVEKFDADGIDLIIFGAQTYMIEGVTSAKVEETFKTISPRGSTPLHTALQLVIDKQAKTGKKSFAIVYTDGEPDDPNKVIQTITSAANSIASDEHLTFCFIQIGDDPDATKFLSVLDDKIQAKFDIVDSITMEEADSMNILQLLTKAIND